MINKKKSQEILASAIGLFIEKGYQNTKIIDIAEAAGVGKGTVYEYFTGKEELLLMVLENVVSKDFERVDTLIMEKDNCYQQLLAYLNTHMGLMQKYGRNLPDLAQQLLNPANKLSSEIIHIIHGIMDHQYGVLWNILDRGAKSGEIGCSNVSLAASAVMGAINYFITLKSQCGSLPKDAEFSWAKEAASWTEKDLMDFLMDGLTNKS
ncbi:MAG: TetR/AcrR family transcriptional regulator [Anaerovoracaceae bacterium]|nr:TetR/AcrR family transcriptional regulator [Anaerovoracaceae bacterium]